MLRAIIAEYDYHLRFVQKWMNGWGLVAKSLGAMAAIAVVAASLKGLLGL